MDPLAQLQDIHLPEQINQYPVAFGWWISAIIFLTLLSFLIVVIIKYRRKIKNKNLALTSLKQNPKMPIEQTVTLLKWAAMQYFPRGDIAQLYGSNFQQFLSHQLPEKLQQRFQQLSSPAFQRLYQQGLEDQPDESFNQAAKLWLSMALPPKPIKDNTNATVQVSGDKS